MLSLILVLALIGAVSSTPCPAWSGNCGDYTPSNKCFFYPVGYGTHDFGGAKYICSLYGGQLAHVGSALENAALSALPWIPSFLGPGIGYYIGLEVPPNTCGPAALPWVDGITTDYMNWGDSWPRCNSETTAAVAQLVGDTLQWANGREGTYYPYICQVAGSCACGVQPCNNGGTCVAGADDGYVCQCSGGYTGTNCETPPSPVDCVTAWGDWSVCVGPCGSGTQTRSQYVVTPAAYGGTACPSPLPSEMQSCPLAPCAVCAASCLSAGTCSVRNGLCVCLDNSLEGPDCHSALVGLWTTACFGSSSSSGGGDTSAQTSLFTVAADGSFEYLSIVFADMNTCQALGAPMLRTSTKGAWTDLGQWNAATDPSVRKLRLVVSELTGELSATMSLSDFASHCNCGAITSIDQCPVSNTCGLMPSGTTVSFLYKSWAPFEHHGFQFIGSPIIGLTPVFPATLSYSTNPGMVYYDVYDLHGSWGAPNSPAHMADYCDSPTNSGHGPASKTTTITATNAMTWLRTVYYFTDASCSRGQPAPIKSSMGGAVSSFQRYYSVFGDKPTAEVPLVLALQNTDVSVCINAALAASVDSLVGMVNEQCGSCGLSAAAFTDNSDPNWFCAHQAQAAAASCVAPGWCVWNDMAFNASFYMPTWLQDGTHRHFDQPQSSMAWPSSFGASSMPLVVPAGTTWAHGYSESCMAGMYATQRLDYSGFCNACEWGSYAANPGMDHCDTCAGAKPGARSC